MDDYTTLKDTAAHMEALGKKVSYAFSKNLKPSVTWYNKFAKEDACSAKEAKEINRMMQDLFNGILGSRGFNKVEWYLKASKMLIPNNRQLRGTDREEREEEERALYNCRIWCENGSWLCYGACGGWRSRRLGDGDKDDGKDENEPVAINEKTPQQFEAVAADVIRGLEAGCQNLVSIIADNASGFKDTCLIALKGVICKADIGDVSDLVQAKVNGHVLKLNEP